LPNQQQQKKRKAVERWRERILQNKMALTQAHTHHVVVVAVLFRQDGRNQCFHVALTGPQAPRGGMVAGCLDKMADTSVSTWQ
jgi:hypothetical protein